MRLSLNSSFGLIVFDETLPGDEPEFRLMNLLPENSDIFAEATVFDRNNIPIATSTTFAGHTGPRLQLVAPNGRTNISLPTRQPQFAWRGAPVSNPPGPWVYELAITNVGTQEVRSTPGILDTVYTLPDSLQANTSYRWKVIARLPNGLKSDSAVVMSPSSFVIAPSNAPVTTLLYQNFPNPFPAASSSNTCIWFDLQVKAHVELTILDIRGNRVRTLIPGAFSSDLDPGRYGRQSDTNASGCDARLSWDGTADNGRTVPRGIYLVRLTTSINASQTKKIVFLGP